MPLDRRYGERVMEGEDLDNADARRSLPTPYGTMSYLDVGQGPPVVMVHGNPSSAREFLPAIAQLHHTHHCLAPDLLGFGRSDKPANWDHLPVSHARHVAAWLDSLDLSDVTLVVGDWGGPIALAWALDNPERVSRLVITNTWMWPMRRSLRFQFYSRLMGGPLGRWLTRRHHFFARRVVPAAWGRATPLTPELHAEFTTVHERPEERTGMWVFPREILGSTPWLAWLWGRRHRLDGIPLTLLWGMRDPAFRAKELRVWRRAFPEAHVERLPEVGHFVALEAPQQLVDAIRGPRREDS